MDKGEGVPEHWPAAFSRAARPVPGCLSWLTPGPAAARISGWSSKPGGRAVPG